MSDFDIPSYIPSPPKTSSSSIKAFSIKSTFTAKKSFKFIKKSPSPYIPTLDYSKPIELSDFPNDLIRLIDNKLTRKNSTSFMLTSRQFKTAISNNKNKQQYTLQAETKQLYSTIIICLFSIIESTIQKYKSKKLLEVEYIHFIDFGFIYIKKDGVFYRKNKLSKPILLCDLVTFSNINMYDIYSSNYSIYFDKIKKENEEAFDKEINEIYLGESILFYSLKASSIKNNFKDIIDIYNDLLKDYIKIKNFHKFGENTLNKNETIRNFNLKYSLYPEEQQIIEEWKKIITISYLDIYNIIRDSFKSKKNDLSFIYDNINYRIKSKIYSKFQNDNNIDINKWNYYDGKLKLIKLFLLTYKCLYDKIDHNAGYIFLKNKTFIESFLNLKYNDYFAMTRLNKKDFYKNIIDIEKKTDIQFHMNDVKNIKTILFIIELYYLDISSLTPDNFDIESNNIINNFNTFFDETSCEQIYEKYSINILNYYHLNSHK